jgi:hypothetical protein
MDAVLPSYRGGSVAVVKALVAGGAEIDNGYELVRISNRM